MTTTPRTLLRHLHPVDAPASDGELLRRYAEARDETAFAEVVGRNGPLVLRACRNALHDQATVDDIFQVTFLLLARNAARLAGTASVAGWLHTVAVREAGKARRADARRRKRETAVAGSTATSPGDEATWRDVRERIDAELAVLPETYRVPLLLCYVRGLTYVEAARQCGCSPGAFRGRLERGRALLRLRLEQLGLPAAGLALACSALPTVAAGLREGTLVAVRTVPPRLAFAFPGRASWWVTGGLVAGSVATLAGLALTGFAPADPPKAVSAPPLATVAAPALNTTDALGDPLPVGAVARMGSSRFHHGSNLHKPTVSADGKWVVSYGSHTGYRVWELATGREQRVAGMPPAARPDAWLGAGTSPPEQWDVLIAPAGNRVVAVVPDREKPVTRVLDVVTGAEIATVPASLAHVMTRPGVSADRNPAISPNGKWMLWTKSTFENNVVNKVVYLADLTTRPATVVVFTDIGARRSVWNYEFSAEGKSLALQFDDAFEVWDVATKTARLSVPVVPQANLVGHSVLAPDGRTLAIVQPGANSIDLWDVPSGKQLPELADQFHTRWVAGAFSADGRSLVADGPDGVIRIWDLTTRKKARDLRSPANGSCPVFSPDGKRVVVAEMDDVCVLDVVTGKPIHDFGGHTWSVWRVAFAPDGRRLFTAASYTDKTVRVWEPRTGRKLGEFVGHTTGVAGFALSPDGRLAATGGDDQVVRLWDTATFQEVRRVDLLGMKGYEVRFTPDGREVVVGGDKPGLKVFEAATGRVVGEIASGQQAIRVTPVPGTNRFVLTGDQTMVRIWDRAADKAILEFSAGRQSIQGGAVARDGRLLAVGNWDGFARVFDLSSGRELRAFDANTQRISWRDSNVVYAVAFAPGGRTLATGCMDGSVRVWELATGGERARFRGHRGAVLSLEYSPDGTLLASGSDDRSVVTWDATGATLPTEPAHRPAGADDAWRKLADPDAAVGFAAIRYLAARPVEAVELLAKHIDPVPAADPKAVAGLIEKLGSPVFAEREAALKALGGMGEGAAPQLREAAGTVGDAEVRQRLADLLGRVDRVTLAGDRLRAVRAVETLEWARTPEARALLTRWAGGAKGAVLTEDASAAAERSAHTSRK